MIQNCVTLVQHDVSLLVLPPHLPSTFLSLSHSFNTTPKRTDMAKLLLSIYQCFKAIAYDSVPITNEPQPGPMKLAEAQGELVPLLGTDDASNVADQDQAVAAKVAECQIELAPQKHLPAELLSHIFALAYPTNIVPACRNDGPLVLTQVCYRWRAIALNTPSLWNNVHINHTVDNPNGVHRAIDVALEWYRRSGSGLLSFTLENSPSQPYGQCLESANEVLERIVVPYASRLERLNLRIPEETLQSFMLSSPLPFDNLKHVSLSMFNTSKAPAPPPGPRRVLESASNLVSAEVKYCSKKIDLGLLNLPWASLTTLHFHSKDYHPYGCLDVLRKCTNLLELHLSIERLTIMDRVPTPSTEPIELPFLKSFSLLVGITDSGDHVANILDKLTMPNLKTLSLRTYMYSFRAGVWPQKAFMRFLKHSKCKLRTLRISRHSLTEAQMTEILSSQPTLVDVCMGSENVFSRPIISAIARGNLLPALERIDCGVEDIETALSMVERLCKREPERREKHKLQLASVTLRYKGAPLDAGQKGRVQFLNAKGVNMEIFGSDML